jgi:Na+-transporting methylmalonyl-CoA/oxaloacetate decarboxylase gamma subunit
MIRITCTHCRQVLTIDDGFAGGVCRCQHCGTIQTVPASAVPAKGGAKTSALGAAARTLYRAAEHASQGNRQDFSGEHMLSDSTLEELAEIVSSSGLRSNSRRLRQSIPGGVNGQIPVATVLKPKKSHVPLIVAGVVIVVLVLVIVVLLMRRSGGTNAAAPPPEAATPLVEPNFAGMKIKAADTVVYLLDDGFSASDVLPAMEAATYQSIKSLSAQKKRFAVLFWREGSPRYPAQETAQATDIEEKNCEKALSDEFAQGSTDADDAFKAAMALRPDAIVLVTAKAAQLPDGFVDTLAQWRGDSQVRVYTVGINGDSSGDASKPGVLMMVAAKTGGAFLNISSNELARLGR